MSSLLKRSKQLSTQKSNLDKQLSKMKKEKTKKKSTTNRTPISSPVDIGDQLSSVVQRGVGGTLRMYPSCVDFARVYADPFSTTSARIPVLPLLPSKLVRFNYIGSSVISNTGTGDRKSVV